MTKFKCNGPDFKAHLDKTRPSISPRSIVEVPGKFTGIRHLVQEKEMPIFILRW